MNVPSRIARRNFVSRVYLAPMGGRHLCMEGEPGAGGGGGGAPAGGPGGAGGGAPADPLATLPPEQKAAIEGYFTTKMASETAGLRAKRDELLTTVRNQTETLKKFEGFDPEVVNTILKKFTDDEESSLIKAGKIDEAFAKRTERLSKDWERKVTAEKARADKAEAKSAKLSERAMADSIKGQAIKTNAYPEAMEDIVLRAKGAGWTVNDDGEPVATKDGEVIIGKDGKTPLSVSEWIDELRTIAPHLWPRAQGQGAPGSGAGSGKAGSIPANLSPEARMTLAREQQAAGVRH